jgi:hypothetical protein
MTANFARLQRYRSQSLRFMEGASREIRAGRWSQSEELLWASLTLAVKGVALSRGETLEEDEAVRAYAARLGQEQRDRRIREAFTQLSSLSDAADRGQEYRGRAEYLAFLLDDLSGTIRRLWEMVPTEPTGDAGQG